MIDQIENNTRVYSETKRQDPRTLIPRDLLVLHLGSESSA